MVELSTGSVAAQIVIFALLAYGCSAAQVAPTVSQTDGAGSQHIGKAGVFLKTEHLHKLRVCNAYPSPIAVDMYHGRTRLTEEPMPYKFCGEFMVHLVAGDKLRFKIGDASAGTFSIANMPHNGVLLLVIRRHDQFSTAVSFDSHTFASLEDAQIAVIDAYKGAARATPEILDGGQSEQLRYNSVQAVPPGWYHVRLIDKSEQTEVSLLGHHKEAGGDAGHHQRQHGEHQHSRVEAQSELLALAGESYVVIRTGVEAKQGPGYPQELIVYPMSHLNSNANATPLLAMSIVALIVLATTSEQ